MSFYQQAPLSIYDILEAVNAHQHQPQQRSFAGNPFTYYGQDAEEPDEEEEFAEDPRDILYRSLYGQPYVSRQSSRQVPRVPRVPRPQVQQRPRPLPHRPSLHRNPDSGFVPISSLADFIDAHNQETPEKEVEKIADKEVKKPNVHASAPTPELDTLQVSKPQLKQQLPYSPPLNVYDTESSYLVCLSVAGADKGSFVIDFHPTTHELLVKGEVPNKYENETTKIRVSEQRFGSFERTVRFPMVPPLKDDGIRATFNNGLLEISVPKLAPSEHKKTKRSIAIESVQDEELQRENARKGVLLKGDNRRE